MTTQEIYKLANELTEKEINNILGYWESNKETDQIIMFNSLVTLGDSKGLAVATAISEKYKKQNKDVKLYEQAYYS